MHKLIPYVLITLMVLAGTAVFYIASLLNVGQQGSWILLLLVSAAYALGLYKIVDRGV